MSKVSELRELKEFKEILRNDSKVITLIEVALAQLGELEDVIDLDFVRRLAAEARRKIDDDERVSEDQVFMTFFLLGSCMSVASAMAAISLTRASRKVSNNGEAVDAAVSSPLFLFFQHLRAIEILSSEGLDTQAKILARSAIEAGDTAIVLSQEPEIASKYVAVEDDSGGEEFWREYFRSGKMSSSANRIFNEKYPINSLGFDVGAWKKSELKFLSRSVHPTHVAGFMSMFGNAFSKHAADGDITAMTVGGGDPHLGASRTVTAISIQVIRLAMFFAEWPLQLNPEDKSDGSKRLGELGGFVGLVYGWLEATGNLQVEMSEVSL